MSKVYRLDDDTVSMFVSDFADFTVVISENVFVLGKFILKCGGVKGLHVCNFQMFHKKLYYEILHIRILYIYI